jgi:hypothetical protein
MGKETSHWKWLQQKIDLSRLHTLHQLYLKNRELQFTKAGEDKIPPVVHFIWLGPRPFPAQSVENLRSWIAKHPGWKVQLWTDRVRDLPCQGIEMVLVQNFPFLKLKKCFDESENWGEKSDLLRYEILFQEGGVYVDHDVECLQSFEGLNKGYDLYLGLEPPHEPFALHNLTCNNGLIGARPCHPTLWRVICLIEEQWENLGRQYRGRDDYSKIEIVMHRTYIPLTLALQDTLDKEGNCDIVFPAGYFFAKTGIPSLYAKHLFATLWDESRVHKSAFEKSAEKSFAKMEQKSQNLFYLLLILTLLNGLVLLVFCLRRYLCIG